MGGLNGMQAPGPAYSPNRERVYFPFGQNAPELEGINVFDSEFERSLFDLRLEKLEEIEKLGQDAYPNQFPASHTIPAVRAEWGNSRARILKQSA